MYYIHMYAQNKNAKCWHNEHNKKSAQLSNKYIFLNKNNKNIN